MQSFEKGGFGALGEKIEQKNSTCRGGGLLTKAGMGVGFTFPLISKPHPKL